MSRPTTSAALSPKKKVQKEKDDPFKIVAEMDKDVQVSNKLLKELIDKT
jgi:hypothetical protein